MTTQQPGERNPGDHEADRTDDGPTQDPGAYIGRLPERATETASGGPAPKDDRVAAVATKPGPVPSAGPGHRGGSSPGARRDGTSDSTDGVREAGQDR